MKKTLYGALAVALGLSAAAAWAQPSPSQCTTSTCKIVIVMPADCGSGITVSPDPLVIKSTGPVTIEWTVLNPDWELEDIFIHNGAPFVKGPVNRGKTLAAKIEKRDGKQYKYDVKLKKGEGKCKLDPTIMN